jgi:hypothetical protein
MCPEWSRTEAFVDGTRGWPSYQLTRLQAISGETETQGKAQTEKIEIIQQFSRTQHHPRQAKAKQERLSLCLKREGNVEQEVCHKLVNSAWPAILRKAV